MCATKLVAQGEFGLSLTEDAFLATAFMVSLSHILSKHHNLSMPCAVIQSKGAITNYSALTGGPIVISSALC